MNAPHHIVVPDAMLGVEHSLTGRRWVGLSATEARLAHALMQQTHVSSPLVAHVLARQGVEPAMAAAYLSPSVRDLLPDPMVLRDMDPAAERILAALAHGQRIAIFADYDVDGGASAALLVDWLRQMGQTATLYVPDRIDEGYGPNAPAMAALAETHDLIICVDCGTLSHDPIAAAKGADVVVLDHHLALPTLPDCIAVVNPNRQDETGALGHLCAAGVVFLLMVELNRRLRTRGQSGADLMAMLDLVALATVADVAPLIGVNRAFVRQGLKVMARRVRPGLVALSDVARLNRAPDCYHLGYVFGPRINAGGRIGAADLGARLLSTLDMAEAEVLAKRLDSLNQDRRTIEAQVRDEALAQAQTRGLDTPLVWAAGEGWHPGVVGIVASRLKETAHRPAVVIGFDGDIGKGSGRSVAGIDLGAAVQRLAAEGLIEKGGGHAMAAGLSLRRNQLNAAMARLSDILERHGAGESVAHDLRLDGVLMPTALTPDLIAQLENAGPFGAAAPAPRFAIPAMRLVHARPVGTGHLKISLRDGPVCVDAICFDAVQKRLDAPLEANIGRALHVAGRVEINHWNGRQQVQLRLEDAAWAE